MKISVVIPTYNEEQNIGNCIRSLLNQKYPADNYEIIVVDGGSKDRTVEIAGSLGARVIMQKSKNVGGARNDGAAVAEGDIIATTDADTILPENWLETIEKNFESRDVLCVFGSLLSDKDTIFYRIIFELGNKIIYAASRTNIFHNICGANSAFRKEEFLRINGFDENISASDDVEIGLRLKKLGRIYFDKHMKVYYSTRRIEKFGLLKMLPVWLANAFHVWRNKPREMNYARQDYY